MSNKETKTTDTLTEKSYWIRIGIFFFKVKPLNLSQVIEIGELTGYLKEFEGDKVPNVARYIFSNIEDVEVVQDIVLIAIFRSKFKRKLYRRYIQKRLSTKVVKDAFKAIYDTFDYAFFFTSLIFLRGVAEMTANKKSDKETVHGESWVEL